MRKTFIVLGMHRSATSLVAKSLNTQINMGGPFLSSHASNPHGHFEDVDFIRLNMKILRLAGGSWADPPSEEAILSLQGKIDHQIKALLDKKFKNSQFFGWKDPRTTLTIKLYLPYLENPHFITCFRNPKETAKSLSKRDGFSMDFCINLVNEYNSRLLNFLTEYIN